MNALVIYGSRWGGTVDVAKKIGAVLKHEGFAIDVIDAKKSPKELRLYDLIFVGSGIRADKWTKETMLFLEVNAEVLRRKKTALFVSCQMADRQENDPVRGKAKTKYLEDVAVQFGLKPISLGYFGGFLDFHHSHGLIVDIMVRVNRQSLRKNGLDTTKIHDTRDWAAIESWASDVAKEARKL